tara:strand:+ start:77 stop:514 length:438 start_codon:yes stop_codon:yes gene_type:complete
MRSENLRALLEPVFGPVSDHLVRDFLQVRADHAASTLERGSPGKFVEGFVQALQYASSGEYQEKPDVEGFLTRRAENTNLPEGLRVIAPRVARAIYALRSKRSIAHKNEIDPNEADLAHIHASASWIMSEMLRHVSGSSMGRLPN